MKEKQCFKCGGVKPLHCFYKHKGVADGHLGKCKECTKSDITSNRNNNLDRIRAYDRERSKQPESIARRTKTTAAWREAHPNRWQAHMIVGRAVKAGQLIKQCCSVCGSLKAHAHHDDYDKPLDVIWLCALHHRERHKNLEAKRG